jgi:hypothetical protein
MIYEFATHRCQPMTVAALTMINAGLPVVPDGAQPPIRRCQFGSLDGALQNAELMAESEDLQLERRTAPEGSEKTRPTESTISARTGIEW